jgi:hypothetical protein
MTIGPYGDSADDFVHLNKVAIKLLLRWEDNDGNNFTSRDVIELSRFDSLFERLILRAPFTTWYRLTVMPIRYQMYKYHGADWFENDPDFISLSVQECVQQFQNNLHMAPQPSPPQQTEPPIFVLEVHAPYRNN